MVAETILIYIVGQLALSHAAKLAYGVPHRLVALLVIELVKHQGGATFQEYVITIQSLLLLHGLRTIYAVCHAVVLKREVHLPLRVQPAVNRRCDALRCGLCHGYLNAFALHCRTWEDYLPVVCALPWQGVSCLCHEREVLIGYGTCLHLHHLTYRACGAESVSKGYYRLFCRGGTQAGCEHGGKCADACYLIVN